MMQNGKNRREVERKKESSTPDHRKSSLSFTILSLEKLLDNVRSEKKEAERKREKNLHDI